MLRNMTMIVAVCVSLCGYARGQDTVVEKELQRLRIPEKLIPRGKLALFMVRAEGVQIYGAQVKDGKSAWVLQAPRATLLDYQTGEQVGTHSKGPTWMDSDGGKLTGKLLENNPAPNPNAIPWLLLEVASEGGGRFAKVTHIQRVDTWAGKAPAAAPTKMGETKEVRYQATYVFWGDR
jgi:hypothetical protein